LKKWVQPALEDTEIKDAIATSGRVELNVWRSVILRFKNWIIIIFIEENTKYVRLTSQKSWEKNRKRFCLDEYMY
jgi:hypothetical protein